MGENDTITKVKRHKLILLGLGGVVIGALDPINVIPRIPYLILALCGCGLLTIGILKWK